MALTDEVWVRFVLAVLATWRVTHLLANEDGPADIIFRLRSSLGHGLLGSMMDCFHCLSFWVAVPLTFFVASSPVLWVVSWLALSSAACLIERLSARPTAVEPGLQPTEGDGDVLR